MIKKKKNTTINNVSSRSFSNSTKYGIIILSIICLLIFFNLRLDVTTYYLKSLQDGESKEAINTVSIDNIAKYPHLYATKHQITTSPKSGRRFLAMVTSYTASEERRNEFYQAWHNVWPELTIVTELSYLNDPKVLRGYAILSSNVLGLYKAVEFSNHAEAFNQSDFDYFIILEDDAVPFENTTWPTATNNNNNNNDLDQMLDEMEATNKNAGAFFLGSHTVESKDRKQLIETNGKLKRNNSTSFTKIARIQKGYGAYAWILSRTYLPRLQQQFATVLKKKTTDYGTPDDDAHRFFQSHKIGEYIAVPLMVDHRPHGISYTWNSTTKFRPWEGNRDWWNFNDEWHPNWDKEKKTIILPPPKR